MICSFFIWILDCHPSETLENLKDLPSWGPCLAFKNKSNDCGNGPETPFYIYVNLLNKDGWVGSFYLVRQYQVKTMQINQISMIEKMNYYFQVFTRFTSGN